MLTNNALGLDLSIEKGSKFINNNSAIVKKIFKIASYNDEPKLYIYEAYFKDKYSNGKSEDALVSASGISFNKRKALMRVLGETLERYSLGGNNNNKFTYNTLRELRDLNKLTIDPETLIAFSDKKRYAYNLDKKKLHWVEGKSLISSEKILVPGQLVYVPYLYQHSESLIRFPLSTGAATGATSNDALYRGICEIVERDAFMISYLNKLPSPQIDLPFLNDKELDNIVNMLKRYKLEPIVIDLTTDLQIPAFAAITIDKTGLGPAVCVGLKAGFDVKESIIGAMEESLMMRSWIRDKFIYNDPQYKRGKEIITIEDRAHFWFPVSAIKYLDFWIKNKTFKKLNTKDLRAPKNKLKKALSIFTKKRIDVFYVDIADKEVRKYDFMVVKVIIPQLQPLYLDERYPYLGGNRLYNTPVKMGLLEKPNKENQLNKVPHPFL